MESREIKDAVAFTQYKMDEIVALIHACITKRFESELLNNTDKVKNECVGSNLAILYHVYQESLK